MHHFRPNNFPKGLNLLGELLWEPLKKGALYLYQMEGYYQVVLLVHGETLLSARSDDVLELDEAWSFVDKRQEKRWLWTALCRRTRQIVAFVLGDRSEETCLRLWLKIPIDYRCCYTFSDFWKAYEAIFPEDTHQSVGKESGETSHMEGWYNTLRQWLTRYTRKTLAFSKTDYHHKLVTC